MNEDNFFHTWPLSSQYWRCASVKCIILEASWTYLVVAVVSDTRTTDTYIWVNNVLNRLRNYFVERLYRNRISNMNWLIKLISLWLVSIIRFLNLFLVELVFLWNLKNQYENKSSMEQWSVLCVFWVHIVKLIWISEYYYK